MKKKTFFTCTVCKTTFEGGCTRIICTECNKIPRYCICGCGTQLKSIYRDSKFTKGHNTIVEPYEVKRIRGLKGKIASMHYDRTRQFVCRECGKTCQGDLTRKTCAECQSLERPCKCGCGEIAKATPFRNAQYKSGHYTRTITKENSERTKKLHREGKYKNACGNRHSKEECSLKPYLKPLGYVHGGDKEFRISSGFKTRYPDYYNPETKQIVEYFGTYWHRDRILPKGKKHTTEQEVINWYYKQGWQCTVVWDYELSEIIEHLQEISAGKL
jgi:hypothetical protein